MENINPYFVVTVVMQFILLYGYYWVNNRPKRPPLNKYVMCVHKMGCMNLQMYLDDEELEDNIIYLYDNNPFFECVTSTSILSSIIVEGIKKGSTVKFINKFENIEIKFRKI